MSRPDSALSRWASDDALNLAVLRVATFATVLLSADVFEAPEWIAAGQGSSGALLQLVSSMPAGAPELLRAAAYASALFALVGVAPRVSAAICAVTLFVLLGAVQSVGAVFHCHHLVLFPALLAFAPSADALTWRRWLPPERRALAYGVPLRAAGLLLAAIFFFPGLWKLAGAGLEWASADRLAALLHQKWFEGAPVPALRIDQHPALLRLLGFAVIAFELLLPVGILIRKTRPLMVPLLLSFHLATGYFLGITFSSLWLLYAALIDWSFLRRWLRARETPPRLHRVAPVALAAALLVVGQVVAGALGVESSWPFACYPSFRGEPARVITLGVIEVKQGEGWVALPVDHRPRAVALNRQLLAQLRAGAEPSTLLPQLKGKQLRVRELAQSTSPERNAGRVVAVYGP